MKKDDFLRGLEKLNGYYKKPFNSTHADILFSRLSFIPPLAFMDVVDQCIDECRAYPTPGDIKNRWFLWLESHPDKKARPTITPCAYCDGMGWLEYVATEQGHNWTHPKTRELRDLKYRRAARCNHCDNWKAQNIPAHLPLWTVQDIENHDFEITGKTEFNVEYLQTEKRRVKFKSLNELKANALKSLPEVDIPQRVEELNKQARQLMAQEANRPAI